MIYVEAPQLAPIDPDTLNVPDPTPVAAAKYDAVTVDGTPEAVAAKGSLSSEAIIGDIQGEVSKESIAQAATGELDERANYKVSIEASRILRRRQGSSSMGKSRDA